MQTVQQLTLAFASERAYSTLMGYLRTLALRIMGQRFFDPFCRLGSDLTFSEGDRVWADRAAVHAGVFRDREVL